MFQFLVGVLAIIGLSVVVGVPVLRYGIARAEAAMLPEVREDQTDWVEGFKGGLTALLGWPVYAKHLLDLCRDLESARDQALQDIREENMLLNWPHAPFVTHCAAPSYACTRCGTTDSEALKRGCPEGYDTCPMAPVLVDDQPITAVPEECPKFGCDGVIRERGGFMVCSDCSSSYGPAPEDPDDGPLVHYPNCPEHEVVADPRIRGHYECLSCGATGREEDDPCYSHGWKFHGRE